MFSGYKSSLNMTEWNHCVSRFEIAERQWREKLIPVNNIRNKLHQREVFIINNKFEEIRHFIQTRSWYQNHETLFELRKKIQDLNYYLLISALKLHVNFSIHP
jgi:hypothetical protein